MAADRYMVVQADVESSREQVDRRLVQRRLESAVNAANLLLGADARVPLSITGGDSVQGLTATPAAARRTIHALTYGLSAQTATPSSASSGVVTWPPLPDDATVAPARPGDFLPPLDLRFGLGWGELATDFRPTTSSMDGPCFHAASAALAEARGGGAWLAVRGFGGPTDAVVNVAAEVLGAMRRFWSPSQSRAIAFNQMHATQKLAALALGVNDSTLSRALQAARHAQYQRAEAAVFDFLASLAPGGTP